MRLKAVLEMAYLPELYKLVDFLNKNLKDRNFVVGLSRKDNETMAVSIYDTSQNNSENQVNLQG